MTLNISSSVDNGTGDYTYNFTNSFSDNNFVSIGSVFQIDFRIFNVKSVTANSVSVVTFGNSVLNDSGHYWIAIGDLA